MGQHKCKCHTNGIELTQFLGAKMVVKLAKATKLHYRRGFE